MLLKDCLANYNKVDLCPHVYEAIHMNIDEVANFTCNFRILYLEII